MTAIPLKMEFHRAQYKIFFGTKERFRVIHKGRRLGLTRGAAQAFIQWMLADPAYYMWGDTVHSNIDKYVSRYFMPVLKQLPTALWDWGKQAKMLKIGEAQLDFRSADNPENWEGFGYKKIFLNEAGIILKDEYLWENAVQPMLLDNPDSVCVIGGTPKGPGKFHELALRGMSAGHPDWVSLQFSTYDNPYLSTEEIVRLEAEMSPDIIPQEIYGEFLTATEHQLISGDVVARAVGRELDEDQYMFSPVVFGVDVARFGGDQSVIVIRQGLQLAEIHRYGDLRTTELASIVAAMAREHSPAAIFIDSVGVGAGVVDRLTQIGCRNVYEVNFGEKAGEEKRFYNKRAECWHGCKEWLEHGSIPEDRALRADLTAPQYTFDGKERLQLEKKDEIRKRLGVSPDSGDALALTFAMPVYAPIQEADVIPEYAGDY